MRLTLDRILPSSPVLPAATPCLLCLAPGEPLLCSECEWDLPYLARYANRCRQCALPLASDPDYCGDCLRDPPDFDVCRAAFTYEYPLDGLIHRFKYRRQLSAGRALGDMLAQHLLVERETVPNDVWPEWLIPVPMHWSRRLVRGFNQAELLATDLGKALNLPVLPLCRRQRRTRAQQGLSRRARQKNLQAAFRLTARGHQCLPHRRVALVDDVVTTGQTARILAGLLKRAGAASVDIWALARTPETATAADPGSP